MGSEGCTSSLKGFDLLNLEAKLLKEKCVRERMTASMAELLPRDSEPVAARRHRLQQSEREITYLQARIALRMKRA